MQLTAFDDQQGRAYFYHTNPTKSGTSEFECGGWVNVTDARIPTLQDGSDSLVLELHCPTCDAVLGHPVHGGSEAQRLHAHYRLASDDYPAKRLADAIESVLAEVAAQHGMVSWELVDEALATLKGKTPDKKRYPTLAALVAQRSALDAESESEDDAH